MSLLHLQARQTASLQLLSATCYSSQHSGPRNGPTSYPTRLIQSALKCELSSLLLLLGWDDPQAHRTRFQRLYEGSIQYLWWRYRHSLHYRDYHQFELPWHFRTRWCTLCLPWLPSSPCLQNSPFLDLFPRSASKDRLNAEGYLEFCDFAANRDILLCDDGNGVLLLRLFLQILR